MSTRATHKRVPLAKRLTQTNNSSEAHIHVRLMLMHSLMLNRAVKRLALGMTWMLMCSALPKVTLVVLDVEVRDDVLVLGVVLVDVGDVVEIVVLGGDVLELVVEVVPTRRAKRAKTNVITAAQYETIAATWLLMRIRMAGPSWHGTGCSVVSCTT
eukprot:6455095-Amphidinium_carterae.1